MVLLVLVLGNAVWIQLELCLMVRVSAEFWYGDGDGCARARRRERNNILRRCCILGLAPAPAGAAGHGAVNVGDVNVAYL